MMLTGIFDSHAHYDDEAFDADRAECLTALHQSGVEQIMNIGADLPSSRRSVELAEQYPFIHAAVGVHPEGAPSVSQDYLEQLRTLAAHPKVMAIGEIGLDYHYGAEEKEAQLRVFEEQLVLAQELALPVVIHSREATQDTFDLVKKYRPQGIIHCYSGSAEMAKEYLNLGLYLGFTGVVTFKNARRSLEALAVVPDDRLLIETDCPYMAPVPMRGRRCDSSMLVYTIEAIAAARGTSPETIARLTAENARTVYRMTT